MELKYMDKEVKDKENEGSNRTFMELKWASRKLIGVRQMF